jgi:hypothetical protein
MKVQNFEVNRLNDINTAEVLEVICSLDKEIEEKIHVKFRDNRKIYMFNENRDYLEECYHSFVIYVIRKV